MVLDSEKFLCRLKEFLQEKDMTEEYLLTEVSSLVDVLDADWEKNSEKLEEALSLFLVKAKCDKEEMKLVCLTVIDWRKYITDVNDRIGLIRNLKCFFEDLKREGIWK